MQRACDTTNCKCYAAVRAILLLRPYSEGTKFTFRIDHHSLQGILNPSGVAGMLERCRHRLSKFEFHIVYRAAVKNQTSDACSRLEPSGEDTTDISYDIHIAIIDFDEDRNGRTEIPPFTLCHKSDHKVHKARKMMPRAQGVVEQNDLK